MEDGKTTDAQHRATNAYRRKGHQVAVVFSEKEERLWEWLEGQPDGKSAAVKRLIEQEIGRG